MSKNKSEAPKTGARSSIRLAQQLEDGLRLHVGLGEHGRSRLH